MSALSFIIPAHDEEPFIGRTVDALHAAARAVGVEYEVIVVDDASTDRTAQIAAERGARVVSVTLRQIGMVRNAGAAAARGRVLVFVDADTVVPEATLRAALAALEAGAVGGGAGVVMDGPVRLAARPVLVAWNLASRVRRMAAGCFIFVRREAFETTGGFDRELFVAEELALSAALRGQGRFVILRERVITSSRKLQTHTVWEHLATVLRVLGKGRRGFRERDGLELWYERRR